MEYNEGELENSLAERPSFLFLFPPLLLSFTFPPFPSPYHSYLISNSSSSFYSIPCRMEGEMAEVREFLLRNPYFLSLPLDILSSLHRCLVSLPALGFSSFDDLPFDNHTHFNKYNISRDHMEEEEEIWREVKSQNIMSHNRIPNSDDSGFNDRSSSNSRSSSSHSQSLSDSNSNTLLISQNSKHPINDMKYQSLNHSRVAPNSIAEDFVHLFGEEATMLVKDQLESFAVVHGEHIPFFLLAVNLSRFALLLLFFLSLHLFLLPPRHPFRNSILVPLPPFYL